MNFIVALLPALLFTHALSVPLGCQPRTYTFDNLEPGTEVVSSWDGAWSLETVRRSDGASHASAIFDSAFPPENELDLGTPGECSGGPGRGRGGRNNTPGANCNSLGNLIVAHSGDLAELRHCRCSAHMCNDCQPNDDHAGASFKFYFRDSVFFEHAVAVDLDGYEALTIKLPNGIKRVVSGVGPNAVQFIPIGAFLIPGETLTLVCSGSCGFAMFTMNVCSFPASSPAKISKFSPLAFSSVPALTATSSPFSLAPASSMSTVISVSSAPFATVSAVFASSLVTSQTPSDASVSFAMSESKSMIPLSPLTESPDLYTSVSASPEMLVSPSILPEPSLPAFSLEPLRTSKESVPLSAPALSSEVVETSALVTSESMASTTTATVTLEMIDNTPTFTVISEVSVSATSAVIPAIFAPTTNAVVTPEVDESGSPAVMTPDIVISATSAIDTTEPFAPTPSIAVTPEIAYSKSGSITFEVVAPTQITAATFDLPDISLVASPEIIMSTMSATESPEVVAPSGLAEVTDSLTSAVTPGMVAFMQVAAATDEVAVSTGMASTTPEVVAFTQVAVATDEVAVSIDMATTTPEVIAFTQVAVATDEVAVSIDMATTTPEMVAFTQVAAATDEIATSTVMASTTPEVVAFTQVAAATDEVAVSTDMATTTSEIVTFKQTAAATDEVSVSTYMATTTPEAVAFTQVAATTDEVAVSTYMATTTPEAVAFTQVAVATDEVAVSTGMATTTPEVVAFTQVAATTDEVAVSTDMATTTSEIVTFKQTAAATDEGIPEVFRVTPSAVVTPEIFVSPETSVFTSSPAMTAEVFASMLTATETPDVVAFTTIATAAETPGVVASTTSATMTPEVVVSFSPSFESSTSEPFAFSSEPPITLYGEKNIPCSMEYAPIDFNDVSVGFPVRFGDGFRLSTRRLGPVSRDDASAVFDSQDPSIIDTDLGSPNVKCGTGGPGTGYGGKPGARGENCKPLGKLLIAHEGDVYQLRRTCMHCPSCLQCSPDDSSHGAEFKFTFTIASVLQELVVLDVDELPRSLSIKDHNGYLYEYAGYGNNGKLKIDLKDKYVPAGSTLTITCAGSCGIAKIARKRCTSTAPTPTPGFPTKKRCAIKTVDFKWRPTGSRIGRGQDWVLRASRLNDGASRTHDVSAAFNTSRPTAGDFDLGAPNARCPGGGPGIGAGGAPGAPGENCEQVGQVLIAHSGNTHVLRQACKRCSPGAFCDDCAPNDHAGGAHFAFSFVRAVRVVSIVLMDLDDALNSARIITPAGVIAIRGLGDNSKQTVHLGGVPLEVADTMSVYCVSSCAIVGFDYLPCL